MNKNPHHWWTFQSRILFAALTAALAATFTVALNPAARAATGDAPTWAQVTGVMSRTVETSAPTVTFTPVGPMTSSPDGKGTGTITAVVGQRTPSGDGSGQVVFLWHNDTFIGYDSQAEKVGVTAVAATAGGFTVSYPGYRVGDPLAKPSGRPVKATYTWTGSGFRASATPPTDGTTIKLVATAPAITFAPQRSAAAQSAAVPSNAPAVGMAATPDGKGYWLTASDGGVFAFGDALFYGSEGGQKLNAPVVGMAATPDGKGYWLTASDGGVFAFGDALFYGSEGGQKLNAPVVGMAATPDGKGYWLTASDGGVFAFGDALFYGSEGGQKLNAPVVGMAATPDGKGYWLTASDGGVFAFGDALFYGSEGGQKLNAPVVGMAATPDGKGYWLTASDGGVFAFGDALFYGSMGAYHLSAPMVGIAAVPGGNGYWTVAHDGGLFSFGSADFYGNILDVTTANSTCSSNPGSGDAVTRWTPVVNCVLSMLGQPTSLNADVLIIIKGESGGNPSIVNTWDSNAKKGTPSQGLMQVIQPTFDAYHSPALSDSIIDPAANIYAGLNYGIHRYGAIAKIPGVVAVNAGKAYVGY